ADVAFLHEVEEVVEGALVLARDHDDQTEVRGHEPPRGRPVAVLVPADRELVLFLTREDRDAADPGEVALAGIGRNEVSRLPHRWTVGPHRLGGGIRLARGGPGEDVLGLALRVTPHRTLTGRSPGVRDPGLRTRGALAGSRSTRLRSSRPHP